MDQSIERLFIAYFGLYEAVTGKALDEDASEAELLEEVLFDSCSSSSSEERLAYYGLCKALYQLPSAFCPEEEEEDDAYANSVDLTNCTLLFVPLEGRKHLLAIVKVTTHVSRDVTLNGIQTAVECSHALFCMIEQWGITRQNNNGKLELFQGLDEAYRLQKLARKLASPPQQQQQQAGKDNRLVEVLDRLKVLQSTLYISSLRKKLEMHYTCFLRDEIPPSSITAFKRCSSCSSIVMDMNELCEAIHASTRRLLGVSVVDRDGMLLSSTAPLDAVSIFALWRWLSKYHSMNQQSSIVQSFLFLPPANSSSLSIAADGFLEPPPLSQVSATYVMEEAALQTLPDGRIVWTPMIHFHVASSARVAFYRTRDTSFLIFLGPEQPILDLLVVEVTIVGRLPHVSPQFMTLDVLPSSTVSMQTLDLLDDALLDGAKAVGVYHRKTKSCIHKSSLDTAQIGTVQGIEAAMEHLNCG